MVTFYLLMIVFRCLCFDVKELNQKILPKTFFIQLIKFVTVYPVLVASLLGYDFLESVFQSEVRNRRSLTQETGVLDLLRRRRQVRVLEFLL